MLSNAEQRVLNAIEVELSRTDPELAAALSFARDTRRPGRSARRFHRLVRVVLGLCTVLAFAAGWVWSGEAPGPCPPGRSMNDHDAPAAVADPNRPLPDNIGCPAQVLTPTG
jgi:hypothetical protein